MQQADFNERLLEILKPFILLGSSAFSFGKKVDFLLEGILSAGETDALIKLCWEIEKLKSAGDIARGAVPAAAKKA